MAGSRKIRVGIVGANPSRGFASSAHIPALKALPDFEITAVCQKREPDTCRGTERQIGIASSVSI